MDDGSGDALGEWWRGGGRKGLVSKKHIAGFLFSIFFPL